MKWACFDQRDLITDEEVLLQYDAWSFVYEYHAHNVKTKFICKWAIDKIEDYVYGTINKDELLRSLKRYHDQVMFMVFDKEFYDAWVSFMNDNRKRIAKIKEQNRQTENI